MAAGGRRAGRAAAVADAGRAAAFDVHELVVTLQCAGNRRAGLMAVRDIPGEIPWGPGAIGTAVWRGVALADVLRGSRLDDGAEHIELTGRRLPRAVASIPRHKALAGEVLLAWEMDGEPLPDHGAPLRALVPGYIGARSAKWLTGVRALAEPSQGHYQAEAYRRGWGDRPGAVAPSTPRSSCRRGAVVPAGAVEIVGYAFAGDDRGIVRVDVSLRRRRVLAPGRVARGLRAVGVAALAARRSRPAGAARAGRACLGQRRGDPARGSRRRSGIRAATSTTRGRACEVSVASSSR